MEWNWTHLIVAGILGGIIGYFMPPEYWFITFPACFLVGFTISDWWPEDWDLFKSHPKDDDNDSIY